MVKKPSPTTKNTEVSTANYKKFITSLKAKIRSAQIKGAIAVNRELIKLYWEIGKEILEKQERESWGSNVLERVARDLQNEFPGVEGFSRRNMFRMRAFYQAYEKVPQAVAQLDDLPIFSIPWGHNALILEKVKNTAERLWRSVKYEDVYIHDYQDVPETRVGLGNYFRFYNTERLHQSLGYRTPYEAHYISAK